MMKKHFTLLFTLLYCMSGMSYAFAADVQESAPPKAKLYYKDKPKKTAPKSPPRSTPAEEAPKAEKKDDKSTIRIADVMLITQYHTRYIFKTEIVQSDKDRTKGLSGREKIGKEEAMLFHFPEPRIVTMWMKDTYFPLDMLFIAENGRIVKIHRRATPLSITPISSDFPVIAVLEIKGGMADEYRLKEGDLVLHQLLF